MAQEKLRPRKPLLEIAKYHRSEPDARRYVEELAGRFGVTNFKSKLVSDKSVTIPTSGPELVANLRREVYQTRLTGVPPILQGIVDNSDPLMPPPFSLGASLGGTASINITIGSFSATIDGDGIHEAPVTALADDVLYYRRQVVEFSEDHHLSEIARAYRTYLQVCISLVDAFLGHATFMIGERHKALSATAEFKVVTSTAPFLERIDAWCRLFGKTSHSLKASKEWSDLSKLRHERNRYVHPSEPVYSLGITEVVNILNQCRDGVGGLLEHLRAIAGLDTKLSYIQKMKTAPVIKKSS
jgi:hypothetical protein